MNTKYMNSFAIDRRRFVFRQDIETSLEQGEKPQGNKLLETLLNNNEIELWIQPIFDVKVGADGKAFIEEKARFVECLARGKGDIQPGTFLEGASEAQCFLLTLTIVSQVAQVMHLPAYEDTIFTVNITNADLQDGRILGLLTSLVQNGSIDPSRVRLELTEKIVNTKEFREIEKGLVRDLGIYLYIDDFYEGDEDGRRAQLEMLWMNENPEEDSIVDLINTVKFSGDTLKLSELGIVLEPEDLGENEEDVLQAVLESIFIQTVSRERAIVLERYTRAQINQLIESVWDGESRGHLSAKLLKMLATKRALRVQSFDFARPFRATNDEMSESVERAA